MTDPLSDDAVSRRYRELPAEEPPRALDEAILAASRRAHAASRRPTSARPAPAQLSAWAPTGRGRWYVPLAAAAVIVLAAGLGLHLQLERPEVEDVTPPSPTVLQAPSQKNSAKAPSGVKDKVKENAEKKPELRPQSRDHEKYAESRADSAASEPAPFPAQNAPAPPKLAAPPAPAASPAPALAQRRDRAEQSAASGAVAKRAMEMDATPEKALERIAELRKAGKDDEADKALAEFRKRYPDFKLSDEMKAKVERRP
jgi:hypothetical protein